MTTIEDVIRVHEDAIRKTEPVSFGGVSAPLSATARVYRRAGLDVTLYTAHQSRPFAPYNWRVSDPATGAVLDSGWSLKAGWAEDAANRSAYALGQGQGFVVETDA
jgi:hypothetical protein